MRYFVIFGLLFLTIDLFSQTIELPPDSLIKKLHVKTITSYFNNDSAKMPELREIWRYNNEGKLLNHLYLSKGDTIGVDLYFYKNNLLTEYLETTEDTIKTIYSYDHQNRIIKEAIKGKGSLINDSVVYKYPNEYTITKQYSGRSQGYGSIFGKITTDIDSIEFNPDKTIKCLINLSKDEKTSYKYNNQRQLISETRNRFSNDSVLINYHKYFYDHGFLIKEIENGTYEREKHRFEINYINSNNGLIAEMKRFNLGLYCNYDSYKYEYYK